MAFSRSYSTLASALLVGILALTGCGAQTEEQQAAAASASASAAQESLDGIQTLADEYATAIATPLDSESILNRLSDDEKSQLKDATSSMDSSENSPGLENFVAALSPEAKKSLRKLVGSNSNNINDLFDYGSLNDDQKLALDFLNFSLQMSASQTVGDLNLSNNKIAVNDLTLDGTRVDIPVNVLANHELADDTEHDFFSQIPIIYVDGTWKIDGQKYLQRYNDILNAK